MYDPFVYIFFDFVIFLLDIDECWYSEDNCHERADCENTDGSYNCTCQSGYQGDGVNCASKLSINRAFCNVHLEKQNSFV